MKKIGILMMAVLVLTGCGQQINLTNEESDKIAAYAAYVTLQHDKNYTKKLVESTKDLEATKESSEEQENVTGDDTDNELVTKEATEQNPTTQEVETEAAPMDIASILNLEGFQITYEGFENSTQYEDVNEDTAYIANSLENNQFVVLKFAVENTSDETRVCDILSLSPTMRVSINGGEPVTIFASLLSNDMSTLYDEIEAHASKDMILLVEIPKDSEEISSLSLEVVLNGVTSTIELN